MAGVRASDVVRHRSRSTASHHTENLSSRTGVHLRLSGTEEAIVNVAPITESKGVGVTGLTFGFISISKADL